MLLGGEKFFGDDETDAPHDGGKSKEKVDKGFFHYLIFFCLF